MPRRTAFTLVQLLVILAILLILFGLLSTAVARVREAAERVGGINNLKQLALAVHNYHSAYNHMPPTVGAENNQSGTVHFHLLPFLELDNLFKEAEGKVWHKGVNTTPVPLFVDQQDASAPPNNKFKDGLATTNYAANWMVFKTGGVRFTNIADGTSNTLMFTQRYQVCNGTPTAWGYPALYTWAPMFGYYSQGRFQKRPKQSECDPTLAQSIQEDGIQIAMCDGSVRVAGDALSPQTWRFLTDPADGNAIGNDLDN